MKRTQHNTSGMILACGIAVAVPAAMCSAQSLLREQPKEAPLDENGEPDQNKPIREMSLTLVENPKPKTFEINDIVSIIVSETSKSTSQSKLDTKTDSSISAELKKFPDIMKFLQGELTDGGSNPVAGVGVSGNDKFKGDGKYERSDKFTDRISAKVIDVKPNGTLVLEARRIVTKDKETQVFVLAGECRREDVTSSNTILSNQLAELTMKVENYGDVKDAAEKGPITRFFEAVFDF